ncbi:BgTH12-06353 [Blumeria graminis f. sp. triticale]|uniref:BgtE-4663 n=3 Tax=Blumeria graminis TaxID=34373 RepID=A0A9X9LAQ4_BLUGR|nr:putative secreted effector protein [Blumeria graminis f. sp. tritici 96224]CAD6500644.1 BgTH12-06353 [Blumeria graminis f. sp. triticale]VCU40921.1 BgtE-4663 [Blumeria graminis f. sp. tritici]
MVCILAILLYTGLKSQQKDRLVIASRNKLVSYAVYGVDHDYQLPVISKNSDIYTTHGHMDWAGTYIKAYCSYTKSFPDLWSFVIAKSTDLTDSYHIGFSNDAKSEDDCLQHISDVNNRQYGSDIILASGLLNTKECNERLLVSLVYQRRIAATDGFELETVDYSKKVPEIGFDEYIHIANVVLNGKFIKVVSKGSTKYALAWSQGHLCIFKREKSRKVWVQHTRNGMEMDSGKEIFDFIYNNDSDIKRFCDLFLNPENSRHLTKFRSKLSSNKYKSLAIHDDDVGSMHENQIRRSRSENAGGIIVDIQLWWNRWIPDLTAEIGRYDIEFIE